MTNKFIFSIIFLFFICLFIATYKVTAFVCDISAIQNYYAAKGMSGSGVEAEAIDDCLRGQRRQDQEIRDQQVTATDYAQKIHEAQIKYFYQLDALEKQIDSLHPSDTDYFRYRMDNSDCLYGMRIPSDPTVLLPNIFLDYLSHKEKCFDYLLKYMKSVVIQTCGDGYALRNGQCITNNQACITAFGSNWEWDGTKNSTGGLNCGCKNDYTQKNGECVTYNQFCSILYGLNSMWDGTKNSAGGLNCGCKTGYAWNESRTQCIIYDQTCSDKYGINSIWSGAKNSTGGLICGCKIGYVWNSGQTSCIIMENITEPKNNIIQINPSVNQDNTVQSVKLENNTKTIDKIDQDIEQPNFNNDVLTNNIASTSPDVKKDTNKNHIISTIVVVGLILGGIFIITRFLI